MIDVFEQIKPLLSFDTPDDFYYVQVFQRRKDMPNGAKKNTIIIKDYYIHSLDYFEKKYPEIKALCNFFGARAGLRLNKRSFKKVSFRTMLNITSQMMQEDFHSTKQAFSKACGQCHNDNDKKWIVDIDEKDPIVIESVKDHINNNCRPEDTNKVIIELLTKNGVHLITKPFDKSQFTKVFKMDIQCDNPINLYIPDMTTKIDLYDEEENDKGN
ncbi:MAG: hypothetical protein CVT92_02250 [Bacteroidetes bacterium HGW-Bacteroidetes-1]|jgi:hypothetical protein|nr:MAG: hypothetical protein CVT92_02250 [Bacteroidetes bacterium HGW-Bacteroidetes-1]